VIILEMERRVSDRRIRIEEMAGVVQALGRDASP
jgi:hypothetical protein